MASFDFADIASSLASIFKDEVSRQFNRPSIFNAFASDVLRTVAEEELDVPAPARPATTLAWGERLLDWDVDFSVDAVDEAGIVSVKATLPAYAERLTLDLELEAPTFTTTVEEE